MGYLRAVGAYATSSPPATAGGAVPTMSAHLAMPSYGSVRCGHYYWPSPGSMDSASAAEAPAADLSLTTEQKTPCHPGTWARADGRLSRVSPPLARHPQSSLSARRLLLKAARSQGAMAGPCRGVVGSTSYVSHWELSGGQGLGAAAGHAAKVLARPSCTTGNSGGLSCRRSLLPVLTLAAESAAVSSAPESEIISRSCTSKFLSGVTAHSSCLFSLDASPASSSSGTLIRYTPDSATSPTADHPSHRPTFQKVKDKGESGTRKAKSRTAFSQEQLQTLHQRFQSQKYLSPHQIRELAAALGLTYKQVTSSSEQLSCIVKCKVISNVFFSWTWKECFSLYCLCQRYGPCSTSYSCVTEAIRESALMAAQQ